VPTTLVPTTLVPTTLALATLIVIGVIGVIATLGAFLKTVYIIISI